MPITAADVRCRDCDAPIRHEINIGRDGVHREAKCEHCGADLQWDQPIVKVTGNAIRTGPPQRCQHRNLHREGAKMPREPRESEAPGQPTPWERFISLARKVTQTPKAEVDKREREWREGREEARKSRDAGA